MHVHIHADHEATLFSELSDIWPRSDPKRLDGGGGGGMWKERGERGLWMDTGEL